MKYLGHLQAAASVALIACLVVQIGSGTALAHAPSRGYATEGTCDGFPRLAVHTDKGVCLGLVAEHLGFARGVAVIGSDVFVADMGGWRADHGRVLKLAHGGRDQPQVLLSGLNEPNGLVRGPRGTLYVGLSGKVIQFDPGAANPAASVRDIVTGLPTEGRHPLSSLAVAEDGSLFVNVGSATDHCEHPDGSAPDAAKPCPETLEQPVRGSIIHLQPADHAIDARTLKPYAVGLRNSMALAVLPSGQLLAAINARDGINRADPSLADADLPHDLYDRIDADADYGWPYCYDDDRPSPEYAKHDCSHAHAPTLMLPAHSAPLGMTLYHGNRLPGLDGQVILTYHGYRSTGHRLVAFGIDANGNPSTAPHELVSGWDYAGSGHPQGAPVAVTESDDGSLFITEDHNGSLLRLARE